MTSASASENARYFSGLAGRWDSLMTTDPRTRAVIEESLASLALSPGDTVLDAGAGTGVLFPFLLPAIGPGGRIIALDVSAAMLDEARRKFEAPTLSFVCRDVESFLESAPTGSIDAVACFQAFPHFGNQKRFLKRCRRVLKPDGRLTVFHAASAKDINALHKTLPPPVNRHRLPPAAGLRSWAIEAGFAVREAVDKPGLYRVIAEKPPS